MGVKKRKNSEIEVKEDVLEENKNDDELQTHSLAADDQKNENVTDSVAQDIEVKVSPKKRKKKDKKKSEEAQDETVEKKSETRDPGWDFSATCITAPSWKRSSIWSDDELEDEETTEDAEKSHVS